MCLSDVSWTASNLILTVLLISLLVSEDESYHESLTVYFMGILISPEKPGLFLNFVKEYTVLEQQ